MKTEERIHDAARLAFGPWARTVVRKTDDQGWLVEVYFEHLKKRKLTRDKKPTIYQVNLPERGEISFALLSKPSR